MSYRILVICKGNVCRSAFAAAYLQYSASKYSLLELQIRSAGTDDQIDGKGAHPTAVLVAREFGIELFGHVAHQATKEDINWSDVVVVMDSANVSRIGEMFPEEMNEKEIRQLGQELQVGEISDPHGKPMAAFRECFAIVAAASESFITRLAIRRGVQPP